MKRRFLRKLAVVSVGSALMMAGNCDDGPKPPSCTGVAPVLEFPVGGETFTVGQSVTIRWCIPENSFSQSRIWFTRNRGRNYYELNASPISIPTNTFVWVPADSQVATDSCRIRVTDYSEDPAVRDESDWFTVTPAS